MGDPPAKLEPPTLALSLALGVGAASARGRGPWPSSRDSLVSSLRTWLGLGLGLGLGVAFGKRHLQG